MTFNFIIIFTSILTGSVGLIAGAILKKYPPKDINWWYGYRTKRAMESQEKWDFAQKCGAENMIKYSLILFFTSIVGFFIDERNHLLSLGIVMFTNLLWVFLIVYKTEAKLKITFDK
ncbi:SdpI family protein [Aestuariibaculum sediminum]|uniref:SdpI family protein n=1 Tax=Aestuariibaculum sediminum TaxID=2770637 RepID=A0A8J6Q1R2_9FLAO|nr:SdpI family protein [Aestuariibaculum sediminum]MBD0831250.1 SdpI family protein [Aestuariibaculum sediminum]